MSKFDRSSLINFSGAALLGAAILGGGFVLYENMFSTKGMPDEWGHDPVGNGGSFRPTYYAVAYLKFNDGNVFKARHAYFPVNQSNSTDDVKCAIEYLKSDGSNGVDCSVYNHSTLGKIRYSLDNFEFGSQQRIYVFIDNQDISFNKVAPVSFTPFGAFDSPYAGGPATRDRNKTFYKADVTVLGNSGLNGLYIENHFKDYNGNGMSSSDRRTRYSMNMNLLACRVGGSPCDFDRPGAVIPLVVDPDTGNGWGSKP